MNLLNNLLEYNYNLNTYFKIFKAINFLNTIELSTTIVYVDAHNIYGISKFNKPIFNLSYKTDDDGIKNWYENNNFSDELPLILYFDSNKKYYKHNLINRDIDKITISLINQNSGSINFKKNSIYDSIDAPSIIFYENNKITEEYWYKYGMLGRNGDYPSIIEYNNDKIFNQYWYKNNKKRTSRDFEKWA